MVFPTENTFSLIGEVQHLFDRLPLLQPTEHVCFTIFAMGRFREYYRKSTFGEYAKETLSGGVGTIVGSVQDAPVEVVTILPDVAFPLLIASSFVLADGVPFSSISPHDMNSSTFSICM